MDDLDSRNDCRNCCEHPPEVADWRCAVLRVAPVFAAGVPGEQAVAVSADDSGLAGHVARQSQERLAPHKALSQPTISRIGVRFSCSAKFCFSAISLNLSDRSAAML